MEQRLPWIVNNPFRVYVRKMPTQDNLIANNISFEMPWSWNTDTQCFAERGKLQWMKAGYVPTFLSSHSPNHVFNLKSTMIAIYTTRICKHRFQHTFFLPKSCWRHIGPPLTDSAILHLSYQIKINDSLYTVPHLVLCLNILYISWLTPFNRLKNWDLEILKVQRKGKIWSARAGLYDMSVWIH